MYQTTCILVFQVRAHGRCQAGNNRSSGATETTVCCQIERSRCTLASDQHRYFVGLWYSEPPFAGGFAKQIEEAIQHSRPSDEATSQPSTNTAIVGPQRKCAPQQGLGDPNGTADIPSPSLDVLAGEIHPLLGEYYDRKGDVGIYRERLEPLEYELEDQIAERNLRSGRDEGSEVSDQELDAQYADQRWPVFADLIANPAAAEKAKAAFDDNTSTEKVVDESLKHYSDFERSLRALDLSSILAALETPSPWDRIDTILPKKYDLEVRGTLDGVRVSAFPDSGAGENFMSAPYALKHHFRIAGTGSKTFRTPRGHHIRSLGTTQLDFCFRNETEQHCLEFHVLPKCVHDVVLGDAFLRLTETFTHFTRRIGRKLCQVMSCRTCLLGSPQHYISGWLNDQLVDALPDTGSDVMLMSKEYALRRGLVVDRSKQHQRVLEFADGSTATTYGLVKDVRWESLGSSKSQWDFYVLEGLHCDALLGADFLFETNAFSNAQAWSSTAPSSALDDTCWFSIIRLGPTIWERLKNLTGFGSSKQKTCDQGKFKLRICCASHANKSSAVAANHAIRWQQSLQEEVRFRDAAEEKIQLLPEDQREAARAPYAARWQQLMESRPPPSQQAVTLSSGAAVTAPPPASNVRLAAVPGGRPSQRGGS